MDMSPSTVTTPDDFPEENKDDIFVLDGISEHVNKPAEVLALDKEPWPGNKQPEAIALDEMLGQIQGKVPVEVHHSMESNKRAETSLDIIANRCQGDDSAGYDEASISSAQTNLALRTSDDHDNLQRHFSSTFSSYCFRSMSSESMGRETRTEHSIMRRLSSACERDDVQDDVWMSRSRENA